MGVMSAVIEPRSILSVFLNWGPARQPVQIFDR
jgi:hypothetical protein